MRLFGTDTETALAQPGLAAPPIVCFSIADDEASHILSRAEGLAWLHSRLREPDAHFVGVGIAYDMVGACAADPDLVDLVFAAYDADRVHDVGLREALIDIAKGELIDHSEGEGIGMRYGMTILAKRYFNEDISDEKKGGWRKRFAELDAVPIESWPWDAKRYVLRDASKPIEIFRLQEGKPNLHDEANQTRAAFALQLASVWGMRSNRESVAALRKHVETVDAAALKEFQASGILRPDGTENKKRLQELVTAAFEGNPPRTAPTPKFPNGQVSADRDTLAESNDPVLTRYATAGKNDKYLTTYLPQVEAGVDQPWNPQFNALVSTTRVSSDAQQMPQNPPQGFRIGPRDCWEARPGSVICSVDHEGGELRTMAQRAIWTVGFSDMADVLNAGRDPHVLAAASFMAANYANTLAGYKAGDQRTKVFRDLGKIWNFGKGGGMGAAAMVFNARKGSKGDTTTAADGTVYVGSRFCILVNAAPRCGRQWVVAKVQGKQRRLCAECVKVARQLDAGWLAAWPEQKALFDMASRLTKASRYVESQIPIANLVRGKCGYTQWLNTPFQALLAIATKRAMWLISREMYTKRDSPLFRSRLLLQVHDELLSEMPIDVAPEAAERKAKIMVVTLQRHVPDLAPSCRAEPSLAFTMSKSAKTVRDASGRLKVWVPKAA